ncbi:MULTISPECIES: hypothetical protein [unclassified Pseudomonas]|uniref:Uncharacterized protein n=1 Tax=viral metagenome TaxID=1070528 RepID=A0A6M3M1K1_9ZZZZ|nr:MULTISPECIES: hypothetical protein [unclassified Pseudomonas]MBU0523463.1 hypothetical protein [Gammaproteobacteria bacterium]MBU0819893.1 hypothetical protein [Gammaproteobacteria bacterium]MBU0842016.1 hypothetical protein [Gammaproteobacteria bacterium]MBU1842843.1 hypothetical protein [Gammaproteobacteria bacterium]PMV87101.1 hypothetical protein C1X56_12275 [Pseudomonas sp. GW101-1A09]
MRIKLAVAGGLIFCLAIGVGLWLLFVPKLSGTEFVAFVVAFTIIGGIVAFAPEVQEFSIAGNVVKLREVKNEALKSIEILKKSQAELLRLMLFTKPLVSRGEPLEEGYLAIDRNFWDVVAEAKRIGAVEALKPDLLKCIDVMLPELYSVAIGMNGPWREGFWVHKNFADVAADILNPHMLSETSKARGQQDESIYNKFARARVAEMKDLYVLKDDLSK